MTQRKVLSPKNNKIIKINPQNLVNFEEEKVIKIMEIKLFKYWKTQEVEDTFGIAPATDNSLLEDWLSADCEITEREREELEDLKANLIKKVKYWNEAAMKFFFLGPLMRLVDYDNDEYNAFLEQTLHVKLNDEVIASGNVDFLVATGRQIPKVPFFTLHEYKPEPNYSSDPQGQLLIAMVAAQQYNATHGIDLPLFGIYVIGRLWFFVTLKGTKYTESLAFDATQEDLYKIFCMLRKVKNYIREELEMIGDW